VTELAVQWLSGNIVNEFTVFSDGSVNRFALC
jgi:hypothetical protein